MSSMIKKKGSLSIKPKAPQARRQPSAPSSTRQSIERQSQTPAPAARPPEISPPPASTQAQEITDELSSHQDASQTRSRTTQDPDATNIDDLFKNPDTEDSHEIENPSQSRSPLGGAATAGGDGVSSIEVQAPEGHASATQPEPRALDGPAVVHNVTESVAKEMAIPQDVPDSGEGDLSALGPGESVQPSQLVPTAQLNQDGTSGIAIPLRSEKNTKRPSKRRKLDENGMDIRPTIEVQIHKPRRVPTGAKKSRKPRNTDDEGSKKRKKREGTPEDAEEQEIDHTTVKMAELTKDLRIGKKFSKHTEIKQREVQRRVRGKLANQHPELVQGDGNGEEGMSRAAIRGESPVAASTGPQMRIVNGQIVIDDASLVVDRHARAAAAAPEMEEVEEDDFTRITTSGTFMKREKNIYWDNEANEKFYNGLRMFGTDFEMISKMFPDRNRRQIKLKFNKEEREYSKKISNALIGESVAIDFEEYKSHTGLEYEEVASIKAEHARREEEHNAEQLRIQAEADETTRQKKAAIQGNAASATPATATSHGADGAGGTNSAKENEPEGSGMIEGGKASAASKSKKKSATKKKRRNLHSVRGGGEEVEVLGTIDDLQA